MKCFLGLCKFNNILKMKLKEINIIKTVKPEFRCVSNETQLYTAWVQIMSADIPIKIMFEHTECPFYNCIQRGYLTIGDSLVGQPDYAKNEEWFASF